MKKFIAIILMVVLTLSLAACGMYRHNNTVNDPYATNPNYNDTTGRGNLARDNATYPGTTHPNTTNPSATNRNYPTNPNNANRNNATNPNTTNRNNTANPGTGNSRTSIMYSGHLYTVTNETVNRDQIGVELLSVSDVVTGTPARDGEAYGLNRGAKIFKFRNDNEYNEIVVEMNNRFYRATRR